MQKNSLFQRYFFETRSFEIKENGVQVTIKNFLNSDRYFVPFENISLEPYTLTRVSSDAWRGLGLIGFFMAALLLVVWSVPKEGGLAPAFMLYLTIPIFLACAVIAFTRTSHVMYGFGDGAKVDFFKNNPNKRIFHGFVNRMQGTKKTYLRQRYLSMTNANDFLDVQTLHWLRGLGALQQEEIEVMMEKRF